MINKINFKKQQDLKDMIINIIYLVASWHWEGQDIESSALALSRRSCIQSGRAEQIKHGGKTP